MKESDCKKYIDVLNEELIMALGCTEPIAISLAAAVATKELGKKPEKLICDCSGNIIKNVQGVTVPNSGGQKGVAVAAILGAIGGNPDNKLEVLTSVKPKDIEETKKLVKKGICEVNLVEGVANLYVKVTVMAGKDKASVEIINNHTGIATIEKNGKYSFNEREKFENDSYHESREFMSLRGIIDFANSVDISKVEKLLKLQVKSNTKIAKEGLKNKWGVNYGKQILDTYGHKVEFRAMAMAAAGSDARMGGCDLGVVINSGSGNQGITVTLPVVEYAKYLKVGEEKMLRALLISNLFALHLKNGIGKLSAYCGAVSAGASSGAAITYLKGGTPEQIENTFINALAIDSGMICDGAKASCAAKIATSVNCGIIASKMALSNNNFLAGTGIIGKNAEASIKNVGRLGRDGMKETDIEILNIMIGK